MTYFENSGINLQKETVEEQNKIQSPNEKELILVSSLVLDLIKNDSDRALIQLSSIRNDVDIVAPILWYSTGCLAVLLREIISIYPFLSPPTLTTKQSEKACLVLSLFQAIASNQETRALFLRSNIPLYLYPFLSSTHKSPTFEILRVTSLGVIASLVKTEEDNFVNFLLSTEIISLCLHIMEIGGEQEKIISTFIILKIILNENGLTYICATYERFLAVSSVIGNMVNYLLEEPSLELLKHIVRCYFRLADNSRAREALKQTLPQPLKDGTFKDLIGNDTRILKWLTLLLEELEL
ncbi:ccr4-not transcription complex subunit [Anaeramoeba flamelloides]|uniref:Ccr4-not transcription complex subunit n=1 Tax=Anaeramoeba flamelloides TaxID=1746091 RepID=A0AAV7ZFZ3_9EUKA|nr:ccr4-not transcription complex subunit [Anaeramoeba flamelloides]